MPHNKRKPALSDAQLVFGFEAPVPARRAGDLAGLSAMMAASVGRMLKDDERPREVIAAEMSVLMAEEVTAHMLNAWASEARDNHNVSAARWLALIAVTARHDIFDAMARRIGAAVFFGDEIKAARLGHLHARKRQLDAEIRALAPGTTPIERGRAK